MSTDTSAFHIIHAVVVNCSRRFSGPTSHCRPCALKCSTSRFPCPCTIALGRPVVPDENSTTSGWSNGTCSNSSGPSYLSSSDHSMASGTTASP